MSEKQPQWKNIPRPGGERTVGEIFRNIRTRFREANDRKLEERLVRDLEINEQKKYWILVRKHPDIRDALDDLLDIPCLWPDMILSTIHKAFAMKCDEV
jgi:hypothetical protein